MSCGCSSTAQAYASCSQTAPQPLTDDNTYTTFAAQAGARSSDFTMCLAKAFLITRRLIYFKRAPGDCGTPGAALLNEGSQITAGVTAGLATGARLDPEPISKGILSGISAVFGIFGAAHTAAVATEQSTLCAVTVNYNQVAQSLEQAVKGGSVSADQASSILSQVIDELDGVLAKIAKPCNAACGFRIGLQALKNFMTAIGFPALVPQSFAQAILPSAPVASPGAAGTSNNPPAFTAPPPSLPGVGSSTLYGPPTTVAPAYSGASGPTLIPLVGNPSAVGALPPSIDPGTLLIIGGIAYVASKIGQAA